MVFYYPVHPEPATTSNLYLQVEGENGLTGTAGVRGYGYVYANTTTVSYPVNPVARSLALRFWAIKRYWVTLRVCYARVDNPLSRHQVGALLAVWSSRVGRILP